jgi:tRNA dimethylallyltransferase
MKKIIVPVILGPTAVGKTAFALRAAEAFGCEIVSCDSRQIYEGMDIGTAKPSPEERARVKHHLVDILPPSEPYSAFAFAGDALGIIRESHRQGKKILICGGTGLYLHILMAGGAPLDEADKGYRDGLQDEARASGAAALHGRLRSADPLAASKIHPNDLQRTLRALDILYRKGRPPSSLQDDSRPPEDIDFRIAVINRQREVIYGRINRRADAMAESGLWDEFLALRGMGYGAASPGMICVGYRELFDVESGKIGMPRAIELIKQNTRRYAKRQMTWFRNKTENAQFLDVTDEDGDFLYRWMAEIFRI